MNLRRCRFENLANGIRRIYKPAVCFARSLNFCLVASDRSSFPVHIFDRLSLLRGIVHREFQTSFLFALRLFTAAFIIVNLPAYMAKHLDFTIAIRIVKQKLELRSLKRNLKNGKGISREIVPEKKKSKKGIDPTFDIPQEQPDEGEPRESPGDRRVNCQDSVR